MKKIIYIDLTKSATKKKKKKIGTTSKYTSPVLNKPTISILTGQELIDRGVLPDYRIWL
jgi:hypothetical protein